MAYKPRRSKHHWEGIFCIGILTLRSEPQVLKQERGKVEKAMDVAIHDADQGSSLPALWSLWSPRIRDTGPQKDTHGFTGCCALQRFTDDVSFNHHFQILFRCFYLLYHCIDSEKSMVSPSNLGVSCWACLAATGSLPEDEAKAKLGDTPARFWWIGGPVDVEFFFGNHPKKIEK